MYCPYCNSEHSADAKFTDEHIVPFALGGSDEFVIRVCEDSNSTLGSQVDAPFIDSFLVASHRFFLNLKSTSGNSPVVDLGGTGMINGKEVEISYKISSGHGVIRIARPEVVKILHGDGTEQWQVSGDPAQVREILLGKMRKQAQLGKSMTHEDGGTLTVESLNEYMKSNVVTTHNPPVTRTISPDFISYIRFFAKLTLAVGYFVYGQRFSTSKWADRLREHMHITDLNCFNLQGAVIWPQVDPIRVFLQSFEKKNEHVIAIIDGFPPLLIVSLFGTFSSVVPLGELKNNGENVLTDHGTVRRIALPSRRLSEQTLSDFLRGNNLFC